MEKGICYYLDKYMYRVCGWGAAGGLCLLSIAQELHWPKWAVNVGGFMLFGCLIALVLGIFILWLGDLDDWLAQNKKRFAVAREFLSETFTVVSAVIFMPFVIPLVILAYLPPPLWIFFFLPELVGMITGIYELNLLKELLALAAAAFVVRRWMDSKYTECETPDDNCSGHR